MAWLDQVYTYYIPRLDQKAGIICATDDVDITGLNNHRLCVLQFLGSMFQNVATTSGI